MMLGPHNISIHSTSICTKNTKIYNSKCYYKVDKNAATKLLVNGSNGKHKDSLKSVATKKHKQNEVERKPRLLCLHGFRTSGEILKKQVQQQWPESIINMVDPVFMDAPFPSQGKSEVDGLFDPPYYEWFQFNKEFTEYENFDECLAYIEDCMLKYGPFDGLLGFSQSQGAVLSAALPGLQAKGVALTTASKIKFLIIISGAKFMNPTLAEMAYSKGIKCPSIHFLVETDYAKPYGIRLLESFVHPVVIHHPKGHRVPKLDEKSSEIMQIFLERISKCIVENKAQQWMPLKENNS